MKIHHPLNLNIFQLKDSWSWDFVWFRFLLATISVAHKFHFKKHIDKNLVWTFGYLTLEQHFTGMETLDS